MILSSKEADSIPCPDVRHYYPFFRMKLRETNKTKTTYEMFPNYSSCDETSGDIHRLSTVRGEGVRCKGRQVVGGVVLGAW